MIKSFFHSLWHDLTDAFNPREWERVTEKLKRSNLRSLLLTFRALLPQFILYYVLLSPVVAAPIYDKLLFHPTVTGPFDAHAIVGTRIENVSFPGKNGVMLHGWFLKVPDAKRVVLLSHGNGGNLTDRMPLMAMFLRDGQSVFIWDYEGYGRSQGSPSLDNFCVDGLAAFNWLVANKGYAESQIIVFGESLGTAVTCQIASQRKVAGIILQSPFTSLPTLARQKVLFLKLFPNQLFPKTGQLNNLAILSKPHAPLLIVHGKQDRLIPFEHAKKIYEQAAAPKTLVELPNAGHNDIYEVDFEQYNAAVKEFLSNQID